jgi:hypothetical protein
MPVINGRYYMNPQYGAALEAARAADAAIHASKNPESTRREPLSERALDKISPQPQMSSRAAALNAPGQPPEVYDDMKVNHLRARQVANVVANENRDVTHGESTPEELQRAKVAQAHAVINADEMYGSQRQKRVKTASADVAPELANSGQYQQALDAARTAFQEHLSGKDPLGGRMLFNNRSNPSQRPRLVGDEYAQPHGEPFGPFQRGKEKVYTQIYNNPKNMAKPSHYPRGHSQEIGVPSKQIAWLVLWATLAIPTSAAAQQRGQNLVAPMLTCAMYEAGGPWVPKYLRADGLLRFSYLFDFPRAHPGPYDYGIEDEAGDSLLVVFWSSDKSRGEFLDVSVERYKPRLWLTISNDGQVAYSASGLKSFDFFQGGDGVRSRYLNRLARLRSAPVESVAVSSVGRPAALCDSITHPHPEWDPDWKPAPSAK